MNTLLSTGQAAKILRTTEPRLAETVRRGKVTPEPIIVAGRRLWRLDQVRQAGIAIKLSDTPGEVRSVAPSVGEHTHEVLEALGYEQSERSRLYDTGAVA